MYNLKINVYSRFGFAARVHYVYFMAFTNSVYQNPELNFEKIETLLEDQDRDGDMTQSFSMLRLTCQRHNKQSQLESQLQ